MSVDLRHRFLFDTLPVRGLHVRLQESWQEILRHTHYPPVLQSALGEMLAASALLAGNLKIDGVLTLQIQPRNAAQNPLVRLLVVESTAANTVRATARWDENRTLPEHAPLSALVGDDAVFVLTFQPQDGEAWQGIVPLEGENIASILMNYMLRSEQLDTHLTLHADSQQVGGLLLQRLPEVEMDGQAWEYVTALANTITPDELLQLPAERLLFRLFHETPPRMFSPDQLHFACTCSEEKVRRSLVFLGAEEVESILAEQGKVELHCDFCHRAYTFSPEEARALFPSV